MNVVPFVLGFPSQVFWLSDVSWWAAAKTKTHSTNRSETITWSIRSSLHLDQTPSLLSRLHTRFTSTPSQVLVSVRGGFLVLTPLTHRPECLGESLGHVRALPRCQINGTHESRCMFFALPASAGPSDHLWSTILISTAFIHHTCRWRSNHCTQLQVVSEA